MNQICKQIRKIMNMLPVNGFIVIKALFIARATCSIFCRFIQIFIPFFPKIN